jgi:hypothetical protein
MPRMLRVTAEAVVGPHGPTLVACVRGGVEDYFTEYSPAVRAVHSRRSRANIIRDHIISRVMEAFANVPGVNRVANATRGRYTLLSIEGGAILRFKYLGRNRRSQNVKTDTSDAFVDNQAVVPGLDPQATRFDVGYVWNTLQTGIVEVLISCPTPTGVEYVIPLWAIATPTELAFTEIVAESGAQTQVVAADTQREAAENDGSPGA